MPSALIFNTFYVKLNNTRAFAKGNYFTRKFVLIELQILGVDHKRPRDFF